MLERIKNTLDLVKLPPGGLLLVGVSGGPDSLALLDALDALGFNLMVAHLDHGLRPESQAEADFVSAEAQKRELPCVSRRADAGAFAHSRGMSLEEAARHLRYQFLFREAEAAGAAAVAVGHTADDQVETVLMHLLRGAGLAGLKGMEVCSTNPAWHASIPLLRPLLGVWREEVVEYCAQRGLEPRFDRSNLDTTYYRNRLRHDLLPYLEEYNPRLRQLIWQMAETLTADYEVVEAETAAAWEACLAEEGEGYVMFSRPVFLAQFKGLQRGLVRRAIGGLYPGLRDVDFPAVERALAFVEKPTRSRGMDLIAGLKMGIDGDRFWIARWDSDVLEAHWPQITRAYSVRIPGETELESGWVLTAEQVPMNPEKREAAFANPDPFSAWLAGKVAGEEVVLRRRRPGDRFEPLGMEGHGLKLADFMINVKLPARAREGWPLLAVGEQVAWVPGYRPADPFRITEDTKTAVHFILVIKEKDKK